MMRLGLAPEWTPEKALVDLSDRPYPFFLDGASDPERLGRFSFVGSDPFCVLHAKGRAATIRYPREDRIEQRDAHPLEVLRELLDRYRTDKPGPWPLAPGGAVGYLSYDLFPQIEKIEQTAEDDLGMPDLFFAFYDVIAVFDNQSGSKALAVSRWDEHDAVREELIARWEAPPPALPVWQAPDGEVHPRANQTPEGYRGAVRTAKEHIAAGDVYQVNLSQRFEVDYDGDPVAFYLHLRRTSPAPFGACLFPDGFAVMSNSPERYLLIEGDYIETRPIKGTRPRGRDRAEDKDLALELEASEKDGAEHVMIVDLERNDLGRVCRYHSVHVPEFKIIESYANVHHMVSTVAGRVHPSRDVVDCIRNSFPGGSITGAPKVRAMEIIDELEPTTRGVYCGSIGYIDFSRRVDLNIAIRTAVKRNGTLYFQVGGGIVADSDPQGEYDETITKAQSWLKAVTGQGRVWTE